MVTVKIPDNARPWRCNINGVEYCYEAGSTQSVPEEVAQLIHDIEAAAKKPAPVDPPTPHELPAVSAADNGKLLGVSSGKWGKVSAPSELPAYTSSDNGKVLKVNSGGTGVEWGSGGGGGGVLVVNYVYGDDVDYLDATFAEIQSAYLSGTMVLIEIGDSFDDPDYGYTSVRKYSVTNTDEHTVTGALEDPSGSYYAVTAGGLGTFSTGTRDGYPILLD